MKRTFILLMLLAPIDSSANKLDLFVMGGASFSAISNDNYVSMNQYMVNEYHPHSSTQTGPLFGLGIAHAFPIAGNTMNIGLGLSGYYSDFGAFKGTEYPFINDGLFDSLNYQFNARSFAALVESRLTYAVYNWQPYLIAGIGVAWNQLYNYMETPTTSSDTAAASPYTFSNKTNAAFAYELGLGVQKEIYVDTKNQIHYFLSVDYRYLNFGLAELGAAPVVAANNQIQVPHLYTQACMLSLKIGL
jgi:hypothetical protein